MDRTASESDLLQYGIQKGILRRKAALGLLDKSGSEIEGEDWSGWVIVEPKLRGTVLRGCRLRNTTIYGGDLSGLHLIDCDARSLRIIAAEAPGIAFLGCDLRECDLSLSRMSGGRAVRTILQDWRHVGTRFEDFSCDADAPPNVDCGVRCEDDDRVVHASLHHCRKVKEEKLRLLVPYRA